MISAEIVLDSVGPYGDRLTTFLLRYPKFIHQDLLTHRVFSRSAASARAVPVEKMLAEASSVDYQARPARWVAEEPGMQGYTDLTGRQLDRCIEIWEEAALDACKHAQRLRVAGAHKQHVNRVLEPYIHINVVVTATEFMNFFGLRLDEAADPTLQALAENMWQAWSFSTPQLLQPGEWHLPFVMDPATFLPTHNDEINLGIAQKVSAARCARTSYTSYKTGRRSTIEEDVKLYAKLMSKQPLHASPAEHQATPDDAPSFPIWYRAIRPSREDFVHPEQWGNFVGWRQFRKMLPGEALAPLPLKYREPS